MKRIALVVALSLALAGNAFAHEVQAPPATHVLGELDFPTSTKSPQAQAAFTEGMLYLHIFEYPSAAKAFQRAQALDPDFVMAYWGEAMTYTHPVWNQQDLESGRAALAKLGPTADARGRKAQTPLELDFLHSVETLYGEGDKRSRDLALLAEMEDMARRYPQDDEVQLFLALALLGADEGKRNLPRFLRAAEISKAVFAHNPKHPGAAHYWIHGMDDPQHAAGALEAANALSKIAPDAGHSQHMVSHIYIALGRWQDVVAANVAALRVVNTDNAGKGMPPLQCGHYAEWLEYAWLQQGREGEAWQLLGDCERTGKAAVAWMRANPGTPYGRAKTADDLQKSFVDSLGYMRAIALVDARAHRKELLALKVGDDPGAELLLSRGLAQADGGALKPARATLAALRALAAKSAPADDHGYPPIMADMLEGAILAKEGKTEPALVRLRAAAQAYEALPFDYGPPATAKPPRELLGDLLLAAGRKDEARAEFEKALASAPERRASVMGRTQATAAP
jgi:tetratricopeptide (TPR) repeat protein